MATASKFRFRSTSTPHAHVDAHAHAHGPAIRLADSSGHHHWQTRRCLRLAGGHTSITAYLAVRQLVSGSGVLDKSAHYSVPTFPSGPPWRLSGPSVAGRSSTTHYSTGTRHRDEIQYHYLASPCDQHRPALPVAPGCRDPCSTPRDGMWLDVREGCVWVVWYVWYTLYAADDCGRIRSSLWSSFSFAHQVS